MKKLCTVFLILCLTLSLAACSGTASGTSSTSKPESPSSGTSQADTSKAEDASSETSSTQSLTSTTESSESTPEPTEAPAPAESQTNPISRDGYKLQKVVVLSRHNIRSPMSGKGSALDTLTPHDWFEWSSSPSQLSLRGGVLETENGQFFRKWLESEGLIPENYQPTEDEVRFYANSKQRTIATSNYFKAGFLPTSNLQVESHMEFDTMDPVFTPQLTFASDEYKEAAKAQMTELFADKIASLADNYELLSDVIDIEESDDWKSGKFTGFRTDDTELILEEGKEPGCTGSIKTGCSVSDALVLQYYEADDEKAAFGKDLTFDQWKAISEIKDVYGDLLFTAPLVATNVAHPLLQEIASELDYENRVFTFLCGHDSNVGSVLSALGVEEYDLPNAIENKTPIGCKVVFSRWKDENGEDYISVDLVYQTTEQLRETPLLDLSNTPNVFPVTLKGLEAKAPGLYKAADLENRLQEALAAYDKLVQDYSPASENSENSEANGSTAENAGDSSSAEIISFPAENTGDNSLPAAA